MYHERDMDIVRKTAALVKLALRTSALPTALPLLFCHWTKASWSASLLSHGSFIAGAARISNTVLAVPKWSLVTIRMTVLPVETRYQSAVKFTRNRALPMTHIPQPGLLHKPCPKWPDEPQQWENQRYLIHSAESAESRVISRWFLLCRRTQGLYNYL